VILAAVLILTAGLVAWRFVRNGQAAEGQAPVGTALVTLAPIESGTIDETVTAFGTVAGAPSASRTLAAPRGVIVERVMVTPGQPIAAGGPLMVLANTPATELAARQAGEAAKFAQLDLDRVQRLYDAHLAAGDQLDAARKVLADAQAAAAAQSRAGADAGRQTIVAPAAGLIGAVSVSTGEHVAADAPLLSVVAKDGLVAQLNVEPEQAARIAAGQAVRLASAFDPAQAASSHVTLVGRLVDPSSHLTTVTVPLPAGTWAMGGAVRAQIVVSRHMGLRAPRAALVYDEAGVHLFVVRDGRAHQVAVTPGAETGDDIEVAGGIHAGDQVVVVGAYQLRDGWPVRTAAR
jgi:RND family efflux transporter MFP subunit